MYNILNIFIWDPNILLDILVISSFLLGILVITSNNPMYSILYLIGLFISIAGYLYYIGLTIMSLLYLLIYVGAIAILFLFILSLLNIRLAELQVKSNSNDLPLIFIISTVLYTTFYKTYNSGISLLDLNLFLNYKSTNNYYSNLLDKSSITTIYNNNTELSNNLYSILLDNWYSIVPINELSSIGSLLYTEYAFLFILLAIILLLSIIGAIIITTIKK